MVDSARARRLSKRIVAIVATELEHQVKDPRLAMLTVTGATVTPDLRDAVVYYTVYGDEDDVKATGIALASATGVLRTAVGRQTGIKFTPTLAFKLDAVPENASRIDDLLAAAQAADAAVAQQAAQASYAGDADPYRVPRVEQDDDEQADGLDGSLDGQDFGSDDLEADDLQTDGAEADDVSTHGLRPDHLDSAVVDRNDAGLGGGRDGLEPDSTQADGGEPDAGHTTERDDGLRRR